MKFTITKKPYYLPYVQNMVPSLLIFLVPYEKTVYCRSERIAGDMHHHAKVGLLLLVAGR